MAWVSPKWYFRELKDGDIERQSRESEALVGRSLELPGSLVREMIQTSLDARRLSPVRVRFAFIPQMISGVICSPKTGPREVRLLRLLEMPPKSSVLIAREEMIVRYGDNSLES